MADDDLSELAAETRGDAPPVRLIPLAKCLPDRRGGAVIKHLIGRGDLALLIAPPGAGKSAAAPLIGWHVAAGGTIFGRRTAGGPVIYAACEDAAGMMARFAALRDAMPPQREPVPLHLWPAPFDLRDRRSRAPLALAARDAGAVLVIVDTIQAGAPGADVRGDDDMGEIVSGLRALIREAGCAVLALHHPVKAGGTMPAGSRLLLADADAALGIEGDAACDVARIVVTKNRRGPCGDLGGFRIVSRDLGTDDDGDPITAPVAVLTDAPARDVPAVVTGQARKALAVLRDLAAQRGGPVPEAEWRAALYRLPLAKGGKDAQRTAFNRIKRDLADAVKWIGDAVMPAQP